MKIAENGCKWFSNMEMAGRTCQNNTAAMESPPNDGGLYLLLLIFMKEE
jgi:hypothetical protein